jgi:hypothetical protein
LNLSLRYWNSSFSIMCNTLPTLPQLYVRTWLSLIIQEKLFLQSHFNVIPQTIAFYPFNFGFQHLPFNSLATFWLFDYQLALQLFFSIFSEMLELVSKSWQFCI